MKKINSTINFLNSQESERKTYNPRSFCKVYTMDHQPLNTAEQKDMAEFFIDLVSKLEEMTPELKELVKNLFGGVISNNVVSLVGKLCAEKMFLILHFFCSRLFIFIVLLLIQWKYHTFCCRIAATSVACWKNSTRFDVRLPI